MSPNIQDVQQGGARPLHVAAYNDAHRVAALLIDNGAEIDPVDSVHDATPLWWAVWDQRHRTIELLSRYSRDVWALALMGKVERLRQLFSAEPALARMLGTETTPLMWLPGDETLAVEVVKLFLAHGADPSIKDREGFTAADLASKRGLDEAA